MYGFIHSIKTRIISMKPIWYTKEYSLLTTVCTHETLKTILAFRLKTKKIIYQG